MRRAAGLALLALALVLVPAHAGASTTRPSLGLSAMPARVALLGSGEAAVRVANPERAAVVVDVGRAGFALDLRGRPRVVPRRGPRAATSWLSVRPARFVLPAGASRSLTVSSRVPRRAEPGDHDALVLLTTRPLRGAAGVAVRMRVGVVVVVRAPGAVVRRLAVQTLRVRRARRARVLEIGIANRGNVTETLGRGSLRIVVRRRGRQTSLRAEPRVLRPRTRGIVQVRYAGRLKGWVTARVRIGPEPSRPAVTRTFRLEL
ncbi:MAG: hypothetical protein M5U27_03025 [Gaiella sp.]|nr:hypothetical protein [Gaiella sp.]